MEHSDREVDEGDRWRREKGEQRRGKKGEQGELKKNRIIKERQK